jgi:uncharacterized membrane protein
MSIRAAAFLLLAAGLSPPIGGARAQGSFTLIGQGPATDMSADGSVVVGYDEDTGEAWRWSADTGAVPLGNTFILGGRSDPGSPDVSGDGTWISGTFHDWEKDVSLPGRWSAEDGWVLFDDVRGAARGLSEDGSTLVGLLWDIDGSVGVGLAAAWNRRDGLVILGDPGRNSCANEANSDGSVIVGWIENPGSGTWHPTAWVEGRATILATTPAFCEAKSVSPDGRIIVGQAFDDTYNRRVAAVWLRGDYGWVREDLGALPGTLAGYGHAAALDLSADGEVIVGVNRFDWNTSTGFVWTPVAGLLDIADFLVRAGIAVPEDFDIEAVTGVSDDGRVFAGYGRSRDDWPSTLRSFLFKVSADAGRIAGRTVENPVAKAGLESDTGTLPELDLRKYDQPR